jgi:hypothetical protein
MIRKKIIILTFLICSQFFAHSNELNLNNNIKKREVVMLKPKSIIRDAKTLESFHLSFKTLVLLEGEVDEFGYYYIILTRENPQQNTKIQRFKVHSRYINKFEEITRLYDFPMVHRKNKTEEIFRNRSFGEVMDPVTPLFQQPDLKSKKLQWVQQGEIIFLHPKHFSEIQPLIKLSEQDPFYFPPISDPIIEEHKKLLEENSKSPMESLFYETLDKLGNRSFILKNSLKILNGEEHKLTEPKSHGKESSINDQEIQFRNSINFRPTEPLKFDGGKFFTNEIY